MSARYSLNEYHLTIQGEGFNAGRVAFFLRFSGCNLWSGQAENRQRDADRNKALCPMFCDTDFSPRVKLTADDIVSLIKTHNSAPLIVFTGGEPLLQLDLELVESIFWLTGVKQIAVETNGTVPLPDKLRGYLSPNRGMHSLWVTCSPKVPPSLLKLDPQHVSELKVVYPAYEPIVYESWLLRSTRKLPHLYVQPEAVPADGKIGESALDQACMQNAAKFCIQNPQWRLSIQSHKVVGLP